MKTVKKPFESAVKSTAIKIDLILIVYFLIMRFSGLALQLEFRIVDFIILALGVYLGILTFRTHAGEHFTYIRGLLTGVFTAVLAAVIFALFIWIYLEFLDPSFMIQVKEHTPYGHLLNPYIIAVSIIAEFTATGLIFSFISMMALTDEKTQI